MIPKLAIEHLSKTYASSRAVDNLSLTVLTGCIFGLLGRNGAGKTTTLACSLGLVRPDRGTIRFDGKALDPDALHAIAYVPETPALDEWMTGANYVEYHRRIYRNFDVPRAHAIADSLNVPLKRRVGRLSKGQQTGLALALAFAQGAQLLLLDEPTSGLDPAAQRQVLDLIVQASADGITILFSSHQIALVERVAEEVAIVERGRLIVHGRVDELCASYKLIEATFSRPPSLTAMYAHPAVIGVEDRGTFVRVRAKRDAAGVESALQLLGARSIRALDQSLEDIFLAASAATEHA